MEDVNKIRADNLEREANALRRVLQTISNIAGQSTPNAVVAGRLLERIKTTAEVALRMHIGETDA